MSNGLPKGHESFRHFLIKIKETYGLTYQGISRGTGVSENVVKNFMLDRSDKLKSDNLEKIIQYIRKNSKKYSNIMDQETADLAGVNLSQTATPRVGMRSISMNFDISEDEIVDLDSVYYDRYVVYRPCTEENKIVRAYLLIKKSGEASIFDNLYFDLDHRMMQTVGYVIANSEAIHLVGNVINKSIFKLLVVNRCRDFERGEKALLNGLVLSFDHRDSYYASRFCLVKFENEEGWWDKKEIGTFDRSFLEKKYENDKSQSEAIRNVKNHLNEKNLMYL